MDRKPGMVDLKPRAEILFYVLLTLGLSALTACLVWAGSACC